MLDGAADRGVWFEVALEVVPGLEETPAPADSAIG